MSLPRALAMSSEENDISQTSNSSNLSWRQKVSEGSEFVQTRSTPSTSTSPSSSLAMRSFLADMKLSCTFPAMGSPSSGIDGVPTREHTRRHGGCQTERSVTGTVRRQMRSVGPGPASCARLLRLNHECCRQLREWWGWHVLSNCNIQQHSGTLTRGPGGPGSGAAGLVASVGSGGSTVQWADVSGGFTWTRLFRSRAIESVQYAVYPLGYPLRLFLQQVIGCGTPQNQDEKSSHQNRHDQTPGSAP